MVVNGGAVSSNHFIDALDISSVDAVAAGNIFYFTELSYPRLKDKIIKVSSESSFNLRPGKLSSLTYTVNLPIVLRGCHLYLINSMLALIHHAILNLHPKFIHVQDVFIRVFLPHRCNLMKMVFAWVVECLMLNFHLAQTST